MGSRGLKPHFGPGFMTYVTMALGRDCVVGFQISFNAKSKSQLSMSQTTAACRGKRDMRTTFKMVLISMPSPLFRSLLYRGKHHATQPPYPSFILALEF